MYENAMENRGRGGNSTEHEPRGAAHSNSEGSTGAGNHVKREETQTNKNETPISRQRGQNGRVRDFADTERAKKNTKHIKERCRYGQCYIAKTKSITSASIGIRIRRRGNAGTASWSDRGIGQLVWQYAYQELNYTVYGKAKESKSVTSVSVGLL